MLQSNDVPMPNGLVSTMTCGVGKINVTTCYIIQIDGDSITVSHDPKLLVGRGALAASCLPELCCWLCSSIPYLFVTLCYPSNSHEKMMSMATWCIGKTAPD